MINNNRLTFGFLKTNIPSFISTIVQNGIMDACKKHDINLFTFVGGKVDNEDLNLNGNIVYQLANTKALDGLIVWPTLIATEKHTDFYKIYNNVPIVGLNMDLDNSPSITFDHDHSQRLIMEHLIVKHGYRKIGILLGTKSSTIVARRLKVYKDILEEYGIPFDPNLVSDYGRFNTKHGRESIDLFITERGLKPKQDIEAIIGVTDLLSIGAIDRLNELHVKVPDEIAVVGWDNVPTSNFCNPALASLDPNYYQCGFDAVYLLFNHISNTNTEKISKTNAKLVPRRSCGCVGEEYKYSDAKYSLKNEYGKFADVFDQHREQIIIDISKINILEPIFNISWKKRFLDSFVNNIKDENHSKFLSLVDEFMHEIKAKNNSLLGTGVISFFSGIRSVLIPYISCPELINHAENLFNKTAISLYTTLEGYLGIEREKLNAENYRLIEISKTLNATVSINNVYSHILSEFPLLGIKKFYLVMYNNLEKPLDSARIDLAFDENGVTEIKTEMNDFPTKLILPNSEKNGSFYFSIFPLYYKKHQFGYAVFEVTQAESTFYDYITGIISSAIYSSRLFDELKQSEEERGKLLTSLELINEKQKIAIEETRQANEAKSRFLANVSHEIRTPLNCIIGFSDILIDKDLKDDSKDLIRNVLGESEKLLELINQLLDISKIEAGKLSLNLESFSPRGLIKSLRSSFEPILKQKGLILNLSLSDSVPEYLVGDVARLRQILVNLIGNAIKFTNKGRVNVNVELLDKTDTTFTLKFYIQDTGIGIAKENISRIFESFEQADGDISKTFGGTGLGTAISKQLVLMMNGEIGVDSELGKGSTFYFTADFEKSEQPAAVNQDIKFIYSSSISSASILLVDDYTLNQQVAQMQMTSFGCNVIIANNGKEAIDVFSKHKLDLIFMDINMPEMNGIEATKIIRKMPGGKDIPIIAITANAFTADVKNYYNAGINDVLTKPFRKEGLYEKISYWMKKIGKNDKIQELKISPAETKTSNKVVVSEDQTTFINYRRAMEFLNGDKELFFDIIHGFIFDSEDHIRVMRDAIKSRDSVSLSERAHRIKGAVSYFASDSLIDAALELERIGIFSNFDCANEAIELFIVQLEKLKEYYNSAIKN